jgi:hyperosmotically inducible protein
MKPRNLPITLVIIATALLWTGPFAYASEADDAIVAQFKRAYVTRVLLKDDSVSAEAKDGIVILTGTVADAAHKNLAQETAEGIPGVTRVDNRLATTAEVATDNADTWIGRKVRLTLLLHRNVDAGRTVVMVKDGVVILSGPSTSTAQSDLTTEYAKDIDGVKSVKNEMVVETAPAGAKPERTAGEALDDASITAQVKTALMMHRSTSALKTGVETRVGVVSLTGIARNAAELSLVTKLVTDVQGVKDVRNQMTLAAK